MPLPLVRNNDVPYDRAFQQHLVQYHARLWEQLDLLPTLTPARITALLTYFFDLACHSQHIRNITLGRLALWALPRDWLLATIEPIAEPFFDEQDEWVYRRLIEVYWTLDSALVQRLAQRGLHNPDAEIRETAAECLETLVKCQRIDVHGEPDFHSWESGSSLSTNHTETPLM